MLRISLNTGPCIAVRLNANIDYFGRPVFSYSLKQGIADGFLAPFKVIRVDIDKDLAKYAAAEGQQDKYGNEIQSGTYVRAAKRPVKTAVDEWLGSKHKLKPSTRRGYEHDSDTYRAAALAAIERMRPTLDEKVVIATRPGAFSMTSSCPG